MVTISTVTSVVVGLERFTSNTRSVPSVCVTSEILTVGAPSLSVIVPVPLGSVLAVLPEVTVPSTVKVSSGSSVASSILGTVTVTPVLPAGIVTVTIVCV